jgi:hypothetical protein
MSLSKKERHDIESALARLKILVDLYSDAAKNRPEITKSAKDALNLLEYHFVRALSLRTREPVKVED